MLEDVSILENNYDEDTALLPSKTETLTSKDLASLFKFDLMRGNNVSHPLAHEDSLLSPLEVNGIF